MSSYCTLVFGNLANQQTHFPQVDQGGTTACCQYLPCKVESLLEREQAGFLVGCPILVLLIN